MKKIIFAFAAALTLLLGTTALVTQYADKECSTAFSENDYLWKEVNFVNEGEYITYRNISNGKVMYCIKDGYLWERDVINDSEKTLVKVKEGDEGYADVITCFNDKVYFVEYCYIDNNEPPSDRQIYSYNLSTKECTEENLKLHELVDWDIAGNLFAYDDKVVCGMGQDLVSLMCYDFSTDEYYKICDESWGYFPYLDGMFYIDAQKDDDRIVSKTVRYRSLNSNEDYEVCKAEVGADYGVLTNRYHAYTLDNGDGTVNVYIRYFDEAEPNWIMNGNRKQIRIMTDENSNLYISSESKEGGYNMYSYKNNVLEYRAYVTGWPLAIINNCIILYKNGTDYIYCEMN